MRTPVFLTLEEVLVVHHSRIERYGGAPGLRDLGALQSALAMPRQSFGKEYLHGTLHEMAAAYLYHLCQGHPFIDGNKRTALAAAGIFLWLNGHVLAAPAGELTELVLGVAAGRLSKSEVAVFLAQHSRRKRRK